MKKIAIVGVGFVGGSLYELLKKSFEVFRYDPAKKFSCSREQVNDCSIIFLCLPTPFDWKIKDFDYSAINESLKWVSKKAIIVIKSTVQPGFCLKAAKKFKSKIVFNPEFLREQSAIKDMKNADRVILGGPEKACNEIANIYKKVYGRRVEFISTSYENAELAKIATNAFLCSKVIFCNELKELCDKLKIDYDSFRKVWLSDSRIGESHTQVTKEGGFAGSCFPKDLNALITKMLKSGMDPDFGRAIWCGNRKYRREFKHKKYHR